MRNRPSLQEIESFNKKREKEQEQDLEPSILVENIDAHQNKEPDAQMSELIQMINIQKNQIDKLNKELAGVLDQLKVHKRLLNEQNEEIVRLKQELASNLSMSEEKQVTRRADLTQNKEMILQYIVTLIDEQGFSYNDVARLFTLEGFLPPSPHDNWNDRVVKKLYTDSKY